jgi:Arc/MetJ-type ribon-helix-helix transcriptional regulator
MQMEEIVKSTQREYPHRLTVQISEAMDKHLEQVARGRDEAKAEVVRAALRAFLDEQEDVIGSRRHFSKAFGRRIDHVERLLIVVMSLSLDVKTMFLERLQKQAVDPGDLLERAIISGVDTHDFVNELVEVVAAQLKTKPPA